MAEVRSVYFGYRCGEVDCGSSLEFDPSVKLKLLKDIQEYNRRPVAVSIRIGPKISLPYPDTQHPDSAILGAKKRFATEVPKIDQKLMSDFRSFVRKWIKENMTPLAYSSDVSVDTWLESTNYPLWRRDALRRASKQEFSLRDLRCKSFVKYECYPEYKYPRCINSRSDKFKTMVGPIFKLIESVLFQLPWFIKKVPVKDRPKYIFNRLFKVGSKYYCTDFSTFEASFTKEVMEACEFELYEFMTSELPSGIEFMSLIKEAMLSVNVCLFKWFRLEVMCKRMSGEMSTSLGNSFTNLMVFLFCCSRCGSEAIGAVEGDDGVFGLDGMVPPESMFNRLGFRIKLQEVDCIEEASFCGMIFDSVDLINITNPIQELCSFFQLPVRYLGSKKSKLLALYRCKALSLAHQYNGCPILTSLARYILRNTKSVNRGFIHKHFTNTYERDTFLEMDLNFDFRLPPSNTRLLVEKVFGLSVSTQLYIETYLDSLNVLTQFPDSLSLIHI